MTRLVIIGVGGAVGALLRYGVGEWVQKRWESTFPWHTLTVNVIGCFLLGLLFTISERRQHFSEDLDFFLRIGLLGSFTTYSAFGFETFEFLRAGDWTRGLANAAANLFLGLLAVGLGRWVAGYLGA